MTVTCSHTGVAAALSVACHPNHWYGLNLMTAMPAKLSGVRCSGAFAKWNKGPTAPSGCERSAPAEVGVGYGNSRLRTNLGKGLMTAARLRRLPDTRPQ